MQKIILWLIAISQLALAALTLFAPLTFYTMIGLSTPAPDNGYMIGMTGARFLAYGIAMVLLARSAKPDRGWLANMLLIQVVDFALGAYYAGTGITPIAVVAFPMVNAALFIAGLTWILRSNRSETAQAYA